MAVDYEGNLWVAVFNGSKVIKIDPRKPEVVVETVQIPTKQVTSVAFGGRNLDELYVTTGRYPFTPDQLDAPEDGAIYRVTGLNTKGYQELSSIKFKQQWQCPFLEYRGLSALGLSSYGRQWNHIAYLTIKGLTLLKSVGNSGKYEHKK
ncbi:hypothetical protein NQ317_006468 [Molorchus minor]|uniref:SMP-30/Gluconolactonase/LRE-like region domain-containing protein n=1 Tax=Molorchus minor TaxID=1323400 RepID=A0ABQ9J7B7_9CUCU|nr:hypothetical protein NQ317_006468 [Molorchus minor]